MASKPKCSESIFNEKILSTFKGKKPGKDLVLRIENDLLEAFRNSPDAIAYKNRSRELYLAFKNQIRTENAMKLRDASMRANLRQRVLDPAFSSSPMEGMLSLIDHSKLPAFKGSDSVVNSISYYNDSWKNLLTSELKQKDVWKIAQTGDLDEEVRKALFDLNNVDKKYKVSKEAEEIANAFHTVYRRAFFDQSTEQVPVNFYKNYTGPINHSAEKIIALGEDLAESYDKWRTEVLSLNIDRKHIFGPHMGNIEKQDKILKSIFDSIVSGRFGDKAISNTADLSQELIDVPTSTNIEGKLTVAKTFRFLDAESEHAYASKFGDGNMFDAMVGYIDKRSKLLGTMRVLGVQPEKNLLKTAQTLAKSLPADKAKEIYMGGKLGQRIQQVYDRVIGVSEVPENDLMAKATRFALLDQSLSLLGRASLSSITNWAYTIGHIKTATGKSFTGALFASMKGFVESIPPGGRKEALREMSLQVGDFSSHYNSKIGGLEGGMRKALSFLIGSTGLNWITDSSKYASAKSFYRALTAQVESGEVNAATKAHLLRGGITPDDYFVLNKAIENLPDGQRHIVPESVRNLTGEDILKRAKQLKKSSEKYLADIATGLHATVKVMSDYASTTATARAQTTWWGGRGGKAGTIGGSLGRLFGQFKDVQISMFDGMQYMFNAAPNKKELAKGNLLRAKGGDFVTVGQVFAAATAMAYVRYALEDAANGKDIPDPSNPEVMTKALVNAGVGGIFADFAFSEYDKYGGAGALGSLAGPTIGQLNTVYNMKKSTVQAVRSYLGNGEELTPAQKREFAQFARRNTPFQNHLFFKHWVDKAFYEGIMESIDPGYSDRRQNRIDRLEEDEGRINLFGEGQ